MSTGRFTPELKEEAVRQIVGRGGPVRVGRAMRGLGT